MGGGRPDMYDEAPWTGGLRFAVSQHLVDFTWKDNLVEAARPRAEALPFIPSPPTIADDVEGILLHKVVPLPHACPSTCARGAHPALDARLVGSSVMHVSARRAFRAMDAGQLHSSCPS